MLGVWKHLLRLCKALFLRSWIRPKETLCWETTRSSKKFKLSSPKHMQSYTTSFVRWVLGGTSLLESYLCCVCCFRVLAVQEPSTHHWMPVLHSCVLHIIVLFDHRLVRKYEMLFLCLQLLRSGPFNLFAGRETGEEGEQFFSFLSRHTNTRNMGRAGALTFTFVCESLVLAVTCTWACKTLLALSFALVIIGRSTHVTIMHSLFPYDAYKCMSNHM